MALRHARKPHYYQGSTPDTSFVSDHLHFSVSAFINQSVLFPSTNDPSACREHRMIMADPPFLRLKNEIFLMIIEELIRDSPYSQRDTNVVYSDGPFESRRFSLDDVKSLSLVNHRLRGLSIRALFRHTKISDDRFSDFPMLPLIEDLGMLAKQPSILQAVQ